MRLSWEGVRRGAVGFVRKQLSPAAWSALLHVAVLLALVTLARPLFLRIVPDDHYRAPSVFGAMLKADLSLIAGGAKKHQPVVPELVSFFVPVVVFFLAKRKLRWRDWEHGKELRLIVMAIVLMLVWSGATAPYNVYLGRTHGLDRVLLVATGLLSLRFPVLVPLAVRMAIVMIKEAYVPIPLDDFDFRAPAEVAIIFGVFAWASIARSFKPAHFLIVGIGAFAAYYYWAGIAKHEYTPGSWLNEDHVSNISVAGYVRGWLSFLPESTYLTFAAFARKLDYYFLLFTLVIELGALFGFFLERRVTRAWFLGCFLLNFGIFSMTGICFWKWLTVSMGFFLWSGRKGRPLIERMLEYKLPLILTSLAIFWGNNRVWFYPQTHVIWWDTRLTENYEIYAVGQSGKRYLVSPTYLKPMDMHFTQGRLCYATDDEHSLTGIYATSGSYTSMKALEKATPEEAFRMRARGRSCKDPKQQAKYDEFMKRYFQNLNRGGRKLDWLDWIDRPKHLWVFPKGELNGGDNVLYDGQEKVAKIELWLTVVHHQDGKLHKTEPRLTHTVDIPR